MWFNGNPFSTGSKGTPGWSVEVKERFLKPCLRPLKDGLRCPWCKIENIKLPPGCGTSFGSEICQGRTFKMNLPGPTPLEALVARGMWQGSKSSRLQHQLNSTSCFLKKLSFLLQDSKWQAQGKKSKCPRKTASANRVIIHPLEMFRVWFSL